MISIGTNPFTGSMQRGHNRMTFTFFAVWDWFKSRRSGFPKHTHIFLKPDWLIVLKLCSKLSVFYLKARNLLLRRCQFVSKDRYLFLQKINYVLGQSGGIRNADNFFSRVKNTGVKVCHLVKIKFLKVSFVKKSGEKAFRKLRLSFP